jgi:hypothetical protein
MLRKVFDSQEIFWALVRHMWKAQGTLKLLHLFMMLMSGNLSSG